jgi:hypothetical protein
LFLQVEQPNAPGIGVAVLLQRKQIAVGGVDIGADQHGLTALKDFVVRAKADGGEVLAFVERPGMGHRALEDVMHRANRQWIVEKVAVQFRHAADRAVAFEGQAEHQLFNPRLRHRQGKEDAVVLIRVGGKSLAEGLVRLGGLLVEELAADLVLPRQVTDRFRSCQNLEGQSLTQVRSQRLGRAKNPSFRAATREGNR